MNFCPNCGFKLSEDIKFCTNCGYKILEEKNMKKHHPPKPPLIKSLSFIVILTSCIMGIISLFLKGYFEFLSCSTLGGYGTPFIKKENFFYLFDSSVFGIFVIVMFTTLLALAIIGIKGAKKPLAWVSFGISCGGFLFVLIASIIGAESFDYYNSGFTSSGISYTSKARFLDFGICFYLVLVLFVAIAVFSVFDALEKPLILSRNKVKADLVANLEEE